MGLFAGFKFLSRQQPMPVDDMSASSNVQSITGETVSLYYSNSGSRTIDAGQAAGTVVMGQLANKNILDVNAGYIATHKDTSLTFTGLCFTNEVPFPAMGYYQHREKTWANKLAAVTEKMANGDYCIDYQSGTIYGKKATTASSLTSVSYKINAGAGASSFVDAVSSVMTGIATFVGQAVFHTTPTTRTNGQRGPLEADANGNLLVTKGTLDGGEDLALNVQAIIKKLIATGAYSASRDISAALEASSVVKGSAGNLYATIGRIDSTAPTGTYYVQHIDAASLPSNGAVTLLKHPLKIIHTNGVDSNFEVDLTDVNGAPGAAGVVVALSTTEFTLTISSSYLSTTSFYV